VRRRARRSRTCWRTRRGISPTWPNSYQPQTRPPPAGHCQHPRPPRAQSDFCAKLRRILQLPKRARVSRLQQAMRMARSEALSLPISLALSLPPSLYLTHTHTHTHTLQQSRKCPHAKRIARGCRRERTRPAADKSASPSLPLSHTHTHTHTHTAAISQVPSRKAHSEGLPEGAHAARR
jgi:hypothetical protein